jgi:uncharacterized protein (TIGR02145 family)/uncharacterized repeat protein (TIGR02543 family)
MKRPIILLLAALMALLSCAEIGNEFDNPWDPNGTKYNEKGNDINKYKTVKIGTQTWMAENLDYAIAGSACYNNRSSNCAKYGRLYTWDAANRACPSGWHLSSDAEWTTLTYFVGGASTAGTKLKAASGWNDYNGRSGNGTDEYGFSALPGGGLVNGIPNWACNSGCWWSATEVNTGSAWGWDMGWYGGDDGVSVRRSNDNKTRLYSVRCVMDDSSIPTYYTITFNRNGGSVSPESGMTGADGTLADLPTPTRDGYTFDGWWTAATDGDSVAISKVYSGNTNIYARWTLNTYKVAFDANGGSVTPDTGTTGEGWKLASLPTPTRSGYIFEGWFTEATGGTKVEVSKVYSANANIYAR